jgi:hypothetical protein
MFCKLEIIDYFSHRLFRRLLDEIHADKAQLLSSTGEWRPCEDEEQVDIKPILDGDEDADVVVVGVRMSRQNGRKRKLPYRDPIICGSDYCGSDICGRNSDNCGSDFCGSDYCGSD